MFLLRLIRTAMRSLESNFMRSLLATLGVLIGVSSVVACMSILEGASNDIVKRFKSLGSNVLYVFPSSARIEGRTVGQAQTLTLKDIDYLTKELGDEIESIAPEALGSAPVKRFERSETYTIVGTSETYFHINDFNAARGRVLTKADATDEFATVCCLGTKVAKELFGGIDPVGQTVQISGASYRVIGVMEKKGNLGFVNADQTVFIPMEAGL
jgi:putative ABC transport system permease protein